MQFHWDPDTYLTLMREEVPGYERLQDAAVAATGRGATRMLELGTGTGETARRLLVRHPAATLIGLDASDGMLAYARGVLPSERVELRAARLEEPLPRGPFDVVVSVLAVHHLDGPGKAEMFRRVGRALAPGGRFVLGDVVVPEDPADAVTPIEDDHDRPSTVAEQLAWLAEADLRASVAWTEHDLAVLVGMRP